MNEILDKLLLRGILAVSLCLILLLYKYAHILIYPSSRPQLLKKFYPSQNPADTIHFFSRLLGIGIVFSGLYFDLEYGVLYAFLGFLIQAGISFALLLLSIYIIESITLFNFEYSDEITTRKNICYGIICFAETLSVAFLIKSIISTSNYSLFTLLYLWLLSIVLFGISTKLYQFRSKLEFQRLIIHKNSALAFSYTGHLLGSAIIIISAFNQSLTTIEDYTFQVILKIILSILILPVFQKGLVWVFRIRDDFKSTDIEHPELAITSRERDEDKEFWGPSFAYGLFEGTIFFTSCLLTATVTGQLLFGNFYPVFQ